MVDPDNDEFIKGIEFKGFSSLSTNKKNLVMMLVIIIFVLLGILVGWTIGSGTIINACNAANTGIEGCILLK